MSRNRWQLDGFDFTLALEVLGRDRLPYPFSFMPPPMDHRDDYERYRRECARRLQSIFDEPLYRTLAVLLEPEVRVEIHGVHGPGQSQVVRIYAGVAGNVGTVAVQLPGPSKEHGTDVILARYRAGQVADRIVSALPALTAGTHTPIRARRSDFDAPVYSRHPTRLSPQEDMQQFFRRPRIGTGEITVYPGYAVDSRPTDDGRAFLWLDYPRDGRYLLRHLDNENLAVIPGSADDMAKQIQVRIDATARQSVTPGR